MFCLAGVQGRPGQGEDGSYARVSSLRSQRFFPFLYEKVMISLRCFTAIAGLCCAGTLCQAAEEWRAFTNLAGRKLVAKVVTIDGGIVNLERKSDGRQFAMSVSDLIEEDQQWLAAYERQESEKTRKPEPSKTSDGGMEEIPEDGDLGDASKRLYPKTKEEIRSKLREINRRPVPDGIDREAGKAVNFLNQYRYLCGVPYDVEASQKMNDQATEAAEACDRHGGLSHDIGHFTNLCNLSSQNDVVQSVRNYINDGGANNRVARGHRRWCLNPPMGKTGFGSGKGASAMVAMDRSGGGRVRGSWAYPGKGFFPKDYLHGNGWSLYLDESAPDKSKLKVEVFRLTKRPEKALSWNDEQPGVRSTCLCGDLGELDQFRARCGAFRHLLGQDPRRGSSRAVSGRTVLSHPATGSEVRTWETGCVGDGDGDDACLREPSCLFWQPWGRGAGRCSPGRSPQRASRGLRPPGSPGG